MFVEPSQSQRPSGVLRWAAGIVMAQGVALSLLALGYGGWLAATRPRHAGLGAGAAVVLLAFGAVLVLVGRGLVSHRRASVSPIVLIELLMLPVAWSMGQARQWAVCAALATPALAVLALLFSPEGRAVMRGER